MREFSIRFLCGIKSADILTKDVCLNEEFMKDPEILISKCATLRVLALVQPLFLVFAGVAALLERILARTIFRDPPGQRLVHARS